MIHGDATAAALEAVLGELEAAEDRAARAGHALAEIEELAEEDPAAAAGLGACRRRLEAAEEWLAEVRRRRRDLEVRLGEREALRDDGLSDPAVPAASVSLVNHGVPMLARRVLPDPRARRRPRGHPPGEETMTPTRPAGAG